MIKHLFLFSLEDHEREIALKRDGVESQPKTSHFSRFYL